MLAEELKVKIYDINSNVLEMSIGKPLMSIYEKRAVSDDVGEIDSSIISNEITLQLGNISDDFSVGGRYEGYLRNGNKIEVLNGNDVQTTYYITDYEPITERGVYEEVEVVGYDKLYTVLNQEYPRLGVLENILAVDYITMLFVAVGINANELDIDTAITQKFRYVKSFTTKLSTILNDLSMALDCYVYVDKTNRIAWRKKAFLGATRHLIEWDKHILLNGFKEVSQRKYNRLNVSYYETDVSEVKELSTFSKYDIKPNINTYNFVKISEDGVYEIDYIDIQSEEDITLEDYAILGDKINLKINQPNEDVEETKATFVVQGREIVETSYEVVKENSEDIFINGEISKSIENRILEGELEAQALVNALWDREQGSYIILEMNYKGYDLQLLDEVEINIGTVTNIVKKIHSLEIELNDKVSATIKMYLI